MLMRLTSGGKSQHSPFPYSGQRCLTPCYALGRFAERVAAVCRNLPTGDLHVAWSRRLQQRGPVCALQWGLSAWRSDWGFLSTPPQLPDRQVQG